MIYGDDYGEGDLYGDIAYADTPPAQAQAGMSANGQPPPAVWPIRGPGAPEAGQRVTEQQARFFNSAPPAPPGDPGAPGSSTYFPFYDTPSLTGAPGSFHVTLDGQLVSPAGATTPTTSAAAQAAPVPEAKAPAPTASSNAAPDGGALPLPLPLPVPPGPGDSLLPLPSDPTVGADPDPAGAGQQSFPPPSSTSPGSAAGPGFGLLNRHANLSPPPPLAKPPPRPLIGGPNPSWTGDANSRPNMSVGEDVGRSLFTGVEKGLTGIVGLPGSADDWLNKRANDGIVGVGQAFGLVKDPEGLRRRLNAASDAQRRRSALTRYTIDDLDRMTQSALGPYHTPQTLPGRFAYEVGQNAPTALLPGGMLLRVARVAAPALGSVIAGEATNQNPWAKAAGQLLGGGLVAGGESALARGGRISASVAPQAAPTDVAPSIAETSGANPISANDVPPPFKERDAIRKAGNRRLFVGATPDKFSKTGALVVERMRSEGRILGDGPLLRGNPNGLQLITRDGTVVDIDGRVDMSHKTPVVSYWNEVGRFHGARSPPVRQFMLDPENYELEHSSTNRAAGARLRMKYLPPVTQGEALEGKR